MKFHGKLATDVPKTNIENQCSSLISSRANSRKSLGNFSLTLLVTRLGFTQHNDVTRTDDAQIPQLALLPWT